MPYPTIEEVEKADRLQICRWYRFLPSPGFEAISSHCSRERHQSVMQKEAIIMDRICDRLKELGGMTPEISKELGWRP